MLRVVGREIIRNFAPKFSVIYLRSFDAILANATDSFMRTAQSHKRLWSACNNHSHLSATKSGSEAKWLARWTQAQEGPGSNRSRDAGSNGGYRWVYDSRHMQCLQCFDAVGWAAGRASGL